MPSEDFTVIPASRSRRVDGAATRARILESAGELFAIHGLAHASSKAVAERAGVDLASINYHFGNRDGLYQAVLNEAHRRFVSIEELEEIVAGDAPATQKLRALIDLLTQRLWTSANWGSTVLMREAANQSPHIGVLFDDEVKPKIDILKRVVSDITGIPVDDPALFKCLVSVMAPCVLMFVAQGPISSRLPIMDRNGIADHLYRFSLAGLQAAGAHYAQERGGEG